MGVEHTSLSGLIGEDLLQDSFSLFLYGSTIGLEFTVTLTPVFVVTRTASPILAMPYPITHVC